MTRPRRDVQGRPAAIFAAVALLAACGGSPPTPPSPVLVGVGGAVSGLTDEGLVLACPGLPELAVHAGAVSFVFAGRAPAGAAYDVTVRSRPAGQACLVEAGAGTAGATDVTGVRVVCSRAWRQVAGGAAHSVGVTVDGDLYAWGDGEQGQRALGRRHGGRRRVGLRVPGEARAKLFQRTATAA